MHKDKSANKGRNESKRARAKPKQAIRSRGVSARDVVLPWEAKDEFEQLCQDLRAEFSPEGRMEEDTVLDLAILRWRKFQAAKMRRTAAFKDPFVIELMESGKKSWAGIRKYLRAQDKAGKTISGSVMDAFSHLTDAARELAHDLRTKEMEKEEIERTEQKISGITKLISEQVVPLLHEVRAGPSAEKTFEQAYSPEYLERTIRYEAALDARIDKLLGRLVSLKEYKRLGTNKQPRQITGPSVVPGLPA